MTGCILHRLHPGDNVAVALADLPAGAVIPLDEGDLELGESIAFGHKVALSDIASGEPVIKYGEQIGLASRLISRGRHAHVHNIASTRGRGDLAGPEAPVRTAASGETE